MLYSCIHVATVGIKMLTATGLALMELEVLHGNT